MTYHDHLKVLWCRWNGMRGTEKQLAKIHCLPDVLERMLTERGVQLPAKETK